MSQRTGTYVTKGRAGELERRIEHEAARLEQRIDTLEAELRQIRTFPIELARLQITSMFDAVQKLASRGGGVPT